MMKLDEIDLKVLNLLVHDSSQTFKEMADVLKIDRHTVSSHMKRLREKYYENSYISCDRFIFNNQEVFEWGLKIMAIGTTEVLLILAVALLLFGANKLPEMARALGKSLGEFKKAQREAELELKSLEKPLVPPVIQTQTESDEIRKLAQELGIKTENKTNEQLIEEIKALKASK